MIYSFEGVDGCGKIPLIDEVYEIWHDGIYQSYD